MDKFTAYLPLIITVLVFLMKLLLGFNTRASHLRYFMHKGSLLFRSLVAALIIPPLLAIILVNIFHPGIIVSAALLLLSAAPGAPLAAMKAYKYEGSYAFGISLEIILITLSVITLPLSLEVFNRYFDLELAANWLELSRQIFLVIVLPLIIGFSIGLVKPSWVEKYGMKAGKMVNILLLLFTLPMLWVFREAFLRLGPMDYLMFIVFVLILYLLGHYSAGNNRSDRITLAVLSSSRHVGICLFIAIGSFEKYEFLNVLVPYLIVSIVLGIIYDKITPESTSQNS